MASQSDPSPLPFDSPHSVADEMLRDRPAQRPIGVRQQCSKSPSIRLVSAPPESWSDESAHPGSDMEWWFIHGYYEGAGVSRRHFMASVFRHRPENTATHGTSLLVAVLDPTRNAHRSYSRIDPKALELATSGIERSPMFNLDHRLTNIFRRELEAHGPPRSIDLESAPVQISEQPFELPWADYRIAQCTSGFSVSFSEPGAGTRCAFQLSDARGRIFAEGIGEPATRSLAYATYPTLTLSGTSGSEAVQGRAWLDHQWGPADGWHVTGARHDRLVGWDWLGINLTDGTELLLIAHRDMKTRRVISKFALVRRSGAAEAITDYTALPLAHWESPASHVRYPIAWRVAIPSLDLVLVFRPLAPDQEVAVFGAARWLWEGAGSVSGTWNSCPVVGYGRLELHGYGYMFDGKHYFRSMSRRIDRCIEEVFPRTLSDEEVRRFTGPPQWKHHAPAYNDTIAAPVWDLLGRRGKQWRAIFNLLFLEALGVASEPYIHLASAVPELCHAASLIIDDIEDGSRVRRGDTSVHLRHGLDVAINAANTLYFLPFLGVADHRGLDDAQRLQNYRIIFQAFVRGHFGQALDIHWSKTMSRRSIAEWSTPGFGDTILQMYADKTAAFIEGGAELACIVARASDATRAASIRFARALGVAFQIVDDVLNFSVSPRWGKTSGEDLRAGKTTYVIYRALITSVPDDRDTLARILCTKRLRTDPAALETGIQLIRKSGVPEKCRDEAKAMVDDAWRVFSQHLAPSEPKMMLRLLCDNLLDIVYEA